MADVQLRFFLPVFFSALAIYGLFSYITNHGNNMCDMTYMFEYPQYLKIPLKSNVLQKFPRYNLYVYGEGRYAEDLKNNKIGGIPVLFIPGNAGSHRQVRSLASVSMRMGYSLQAPFHFNYFAVDFNEEMSGLYGGTLQDQTEFVRECIRHIQSLYPEKKKLILVGHSMGGVITQAVFSIPSFDTSSVSILFTLAAPHAAPVIAIDSAIVNFYEKTQQAWRYRLRRDLSLIPIVSIGGGERDHLVRSSLTSLTFDPKSALDVQVLVNAVPGVWVSTDHLAIVWCKQLVLTMCRSMYDLMDRSSKQLKKNQTEVGEILKHHYITRSGGLHFPTIPFIEKLSFTSVGQWIVQDDETWRFSKSKVLSSVYLMIPVIEKHNFLIMASGLLKNDWIFGCTKVVKKDSTTCSEGDNLSNRGEIIPSKSKTNQRKLINLHEQEISQKKYAYILIHVAASNSQVDILGERYKLTERTNHFKMPTMFQRMTSFNPIRIMSVSLVDQSVFYNITLSGSAGVFESTSITLETRLCKAGSVVGQGLIKVHIPWSNEDTYHHIRTTLGGLTSVPIKLHVLPTTSENTDIHLQLLLDPECSIVLTAQFPLSLIVSQFIKFYGVLIPGYTVALLLVLISGQMYSIGATGSCVPLFQVFAKFPTFISLVCLPTVIYHGVWSTGFGGPFLPAPDAIVMENTHMFLTFLLRSFLYLISFGFIVTMCVLYEFFLSVAAAIWIWVKHRTIHNATRTPLTENLKGQLKVSKVTMMLCALLIATAIGISSSVAFVHASLLYTLKLISMRAKCKAEEERRGTTAMTCKWHLHLTMVLLWMSANMLLLPGVIAWAKGLEFSLRVTNDPHTVPCVAIFISIAMLWQLPTPSSNRVYYYGASHIIHILGFLTALYGVQSMYRLFHFICASFIVLSIQQTIAFYHGSTQRKIQ